MALLAAVTLLLLLPSPSAAASKRSMVWIYGSDLFPKGPKLEQTLKELAAHTDAFNAVSPQMYSVGCDAKAAPPPRQPQRYTETADIKWCSDGKSPDWEPPSKSPFGAGMSPDGCSVVPTSWSTSKSVAACEKLCDPVAACLGFTYYPSKALGGGAAKNESVCCFRTGGVDEKPACDKDPSCTATRCYEKAVKPPSTCAPILISDTSDPGITPVSTQATPNRPLIVP